MNNHFLKTFSLVLILVVAMLTGLNAQNATHHKKTQPATEQVKPVSKYKVTFIELGSVRCVPCRQMQPVMKSIEEKYGSQVKVIFYDVWTPLGKPMADKYNVQAIPTQVFLDANGKEFFRHEGFFPEEELVKVLNQKGVR
jgi:thioredoxin 1